jgi:hypothetical protein
MKDLELRDIMDRPRPELTKLVVYLNGSWQFASLTNPLRTDEGQSYYRIDKRFGLVRSTSNNPKNAKIFGDAGEYIAVDSTGEMSLVKADQYKRLFPASNPTPNPPTSSKELSDPNFLTNIVRKS